MHVSRPSWRNPFKTDTPHLQTLLSNAHDGILQLPDFQRDWVWDRERIRRLLASVAMGYPIGAVMLLQTDKNGIKLKHRMLAGTDPSQINQLPDALILDGQQRLTALYNALYSREPVITKRTKRGQGGRWYYYIDMKKALRPEADREDSILCLPENNRFRAFLGGVTRDVSTKELEYEFELFPVNQTFDSKAWARGYRDYWKHASEKSEFFDGFDAEVLECLQNYEVPVIELKKGTPKEAVCFVFERVNTSGVILTVFELLTALFAVDNYQLREDWKAREKRMKDKFPVLDLLKSDDFLQAVALLVTQQRRRNAIADGIATDRAPGVSCKRKDILKLDVSDWKSWADQVEEGFARAARFLHLQKIFLGRDLPYRTQVVPLAAIFADLGEDGKLDGVRKKIETWYWCGVLGELYGGTYESRFARDLPEVVDWVRGPNEKPSTIVESSFQANRLLTLRTRNSSAYKGLFALLMREGGLDFRTGNSIEDQLFFDDSIDIHHIFPKAWCKSRRFDVKFVDSIINKTAISARTNRGIGSRAPSKYLSMIQKEAAVSADRMNEILSSHKIEPKPLRKNRFLNFYAARAESLLQLIEQVTGKEITGERDLFIPKRKA